MFTYKNSILLKKDKIYDFVNNCYKFGFVCDGDNSYIFKKVLDENNTDLFVQITVAIDSLEVYIELHVPGPYWIEFGLNTFEPLFELYKQGYIEIV